MNIYLGDLSINAIEKRVGIKFPDELKNFMESRHQSTASNIQKGKWHCFDIPFTLVCGDMETAKEIYKYLAPFSDDFKEPLLISLQK